jgi:hypothetical protein
VRRYFREADTVSEEFARCMRLLSRILGRERNISELKDARIRVMVSRCDEFTSIHSAKSLTGPMRERYGYQICRFDGGKRFCSTVLEYNTGARERVVVAHKEEIMWRTINNIDPFYAAL